MLSKDSHKKGARDGNIPIDSVFQLNTAPVTNHFDSFQAIAFKADLQRPICELGVGILRNDQMYRPIFVAPASREFSTGSLAAVCSSIKTWPEVIRWTDLELGLMAPLGRAMARR
jgi:hypothetical protein